MHDVYQEFFNRALDRRILKVASGESSQIGLTGYPQGLPSWEVQGGVEALKEVCFWREYDQVLKGFI